MPPAAFSMPGAWSRSRTPTAKVSLGPRQRIDGSIRSDFTVRSRDTSANLIDLRRTDLRLSGRTITARAASFGECRSPTSSLLGSARQRQFDFAPPDAVLPRHPNAPQNSIIGGLALGEGRKKPRLTGRGKFFTPVDTDRPVAVHRSRAICRSQGRHSQDQGLGIQGRAYLRVRSGDNQQGRANSRGLRIATGAVRDVGA